MTGSAPRAQKRPATYFQTGMGITTRSAMDLHKEKARKANYAASAISNMMVKKLTDMRPEFAVKYNRDDQLLTLAISHAAVGIAAKAASQATGMETDKHIK